MKLLNQVWRHCRLIEIKEIKESQTWPLRFEVMYPNKSIEFVKLPKDSEGKHFGLFYKEELVSVVSLFIEDRVAQFRKLATKESVQSRGFGSKLLTHVFTVSKQNNCSKIWCNARLDKSMFYRKFEMYETPKNFRKADIDYVIMEKNL